DGVDVRPDTVYIIPPHRNMKIKGGALHLAIPAEPNPQRPPMDLFFRSLAADQREKAIGVVLSGTGAYGTSGLQAIKAHGGMTMVQDPGEAAYDQMPRSAISAGVADHVLPVARMPEALSAYLEHPYIAGTSKPTETRDSLGRILALIRARTKYDFSEYRKNMLMRRVQRRMSLNHIKDPDSYIHMLRDNGAELEQLFRDFLIGVSSFFRDPEAFAVLAQRVIPELIQQRSQGDTPIRVWIPACAAGEEAYSIAMLFLEAMDRAQRHIPLQIFATDLDEQALKTARLGSYPDSIAEDLSPERLQRFFTKTGHQYQINKALRETVMFASQNVIGDTPLSRMDLISCRNLLIYLEPEAQHKVLSVFHFALNEGGYLFLGTSETVARQIDLFEAVAKHWRIFRRIGPSRTDRVQLPSGVNQAMYVPLPARREAAHAAPKIGTMAQELLINTYVPACVLISRKFETLYFHGATQKYLRMPSGEPTHDLLAMTEQALSAKIRSLCYQVSNTQEKEVRGDAPVKRNDHYDHVRVSVREIRHPKALTGLLLVTFEDLPDTEAVKLMDAGDNNTLVQQLELELKTTREDLQSTIEELESSNEELKASNEEMMSMNEELQSVNEELETSKEELQSLNEELNTVNNQLEEKIEQLDKTSNDLTNLLNSADITTLFLDTGLRIRRFTPSTVKLLSLMPTDIGRSIGDLSNKFNDDTLLIDARAVLEKLTPIDKHVWTDEGLCFLRRILPYRTMANQIEGIVVTFVDITPQVIADVELRRVTALLKKTSIAIIVYNLKGDITAWSRGAERMYGYTEAEALNMSALDLAPSRMHNKTRSMFAKLAQKKDIQAIETQRVTKDGRVIDIALTAAQLADERGEIVGIIVTQQDITERRRMEHELRNLNKDLQNRVAVQTAEAEQRAMQLQQREQYLSAIVETAPDAIVTINRDGVITSFNPAAERMFGYARKDAIGQDSAILVQSPPDKGAGSDWLRRFIPPKKTVAALTGEIQGQRKDSTPFPMQVSVSEIDHLGLYLLVARDITV
ncbi:MAG TPA: CheR family methyltransferase, partial [Gammaproteobacteria bacterium]|nr:CheR family methyltransferase [Gammaproteobacteria bacterium]